MDRVRPDFEQRREYDDFEVKLARFTEEKEKYTKSLEMELRKIHADHRESETSKASDVTTRHRSGSSGQSFFMSLNGDGAQRPDSLDVATRGQGDGGGTTTFAKMQMQREGNGNRNFNNNEAAKWSVFEQTR